MFSIIDEYPLSELNPLAPIFIPQNPVNIALQKENQLLSSLDNATQIALTEIWSEQIYESICQQNIDNEIAKEIAEEIAAIRASK